MVTHVAMNKSVVAEPRPTRLPTEIFARARDALAPAHSATAEPIPAADRETLHQAVEHLSRNAQSMQRALEFSIDETSGRTVITVIDKETKRIIRQIPPQEILSLTSRIQRAAGLILHDEV
jgi:flagellar protein FlaG